MKYFAYLTQPEACDYSIGCGIAFRELKSSNRIEAIEELKQLIKEEYSHDMTKIKEAKIYEINDYIEVSVEDIYTELHKKREEEDRLKKEESEKAELARLQQKYNKGDK